MLASSDVDASAFDDAGALTTPATIGTLVVTPSGSRSDSFAVRSRHRGRSQRVARELRSSLTNCVVEKRVVSFIPHTPITLPIEITLDCKNIDCTQGQTCDHGRCVLDTTQVSCQGSTCSATIPPDASSPADAGLPGDAGPAADAGDATVIDALATDSTSDVGFDSTAQEGSTADSPSDVGSGAADAPTDSPLGQCISAGSNTAGVECAGGHCMAGNVCCVTNPMLSLPTETCGSLGSCNVNSTGYPIHWALACRNWGDCPTGKVCCYQTVDAGSGTVASCVTSCPAGFGTTKIGCQNACECTSQGGSCDVLSCLGASYGICGTPSGATCP